MSGFDWCVQRYLEKLQHWWIRAEFHWLHSSELWFWFDWGTLLGITHIEKSWSNSMQQNYAVFTAGNGQVYVLVPMSFSFFLFRTILNGNTSLDRQKYSKFELYQKCLHWSAFFEAESHRKGKHTRKVPFFWLMQYSLYNIVFLLSVLLDCWFEMLNKKFIMLPTFLLLSHHTIYCSFSLVWPLRVNEVIFWKD